MTTIFAPGHADPRLFIYSLIYVCSGLPQSKDFTLRASGPQSGGEIRGKNYSGQSWVGPSESTKGSKTFQKNFLKEQ